jgi:phage-related protein
MPFDSGSIASVLGLDVSPFAQGMLQAQGIAQLFPSVVTNFLANPLLGMIAVAKEAAGAVADAFTSIGDAADNAGEAAAKVGVSVSFLTTVGKVAADAGSSVEGFADSLRFLGKNAADVLDGNAEMAKAFRSLGVSVTDATGRLKGTEPLFYEVVDAMNALPSAAQRINVAMTLLGRGGSDMLAFISAGSAQIREMARTIEELGGGVDDTLASAGDKFGTLRTLVGAAVNGIKTAVAAPLLGALESHFDEAVGYLRTASAAIRQAISTAMAGIGTAVTAVRPYVQAMIDHWSEVKVALVAVGGAILGPLVVGAVTAMAGAVATVGAPVALLAGLLPNLVGAMAGLAIADDIGGAFRGFGLVLHELVDWVRSAVIPVLSDGLAGAAALVTPVIDGLRPVLLTLGGVLLDVFGFVGSVVVPLVGQTLVAAFAFARPVIAGLGSVLAGLAPVLEAVWTVVKAVAGVVAGQLADALTSLQPVLNVVGSVLGWLLDLLGRLLKGIGDPNVNSGRVPYTEFYKAADRFGRLGVVELWFTADPRVGEGGASTPDASLDGVRLVNYEPLQVGTVQGEPAPRVIELRLFFADFRCDFAPPRGGRLIRGKVNPLPPPIDPATKKPREPESNVDLIETCLNALNVDYEIDEDRVTVLSKVPPAHDLEWYGSHAGEELKKLLEYVGAVAYPTSYGALSIDMLGDGDVPAIPAAQALPEIRLPGVDRRGKTVVFTSIPKTAMRTFTNDDDGEGGGLPKLRFVAQDPNDHDKWVKLATLAGVASDDAVATALNKGFKDVKDAKVKARLLDQAFRCIQFDPDDKEAPQGTVLRQAFRLAPDLHPIEVRAYAATLTPDGLWKDPDDPIPVVVQHLFADVGVIVLNRRLVTVGDDATGNPDAVASPIDLAQDLSLRLTVQDDEPDPAGAAGARRPKYFACGFVKNAGNAGLEKLTHEQAAAALESGDADTVIIDDPTLVLVSEEGGEDDPTDNRTELEDRCKALALRYLAGSGDEYRILRAAGFVPGELSGRVAEVRYNQRELTTTFKVNSWFRPREAVTQDRLKEIAAGPGGGAYPKQAATESPRLAAGMSGSVQPAVPVHAPGPERRPISNALFAVKEEGDGDAKKIQTLSGDAEWDKPDDGDGDDVSLAYFDDKGRVQLAKAGGGVDLKNAGDTVVTAAGFIDIPASTKDVLKFGASGDGGTLSIAAGTTAWTVLTWNGTKWVVDYVRAHA